MADVDTETTIFVGKGAKPEFLTLALANRHGLVTGATGTGKTVTLQVLAEGLSRAGVSVFAADIKGDLSGVSETGEAKEAFVSRAKTLGIEYHPDQFPVVFWDLFGEQGHPGRSPFPKWGRCCCRVSSISMKCRRACSISVSALPMSRVS